MDYICPICGGALQPEGTALVCPRDGYRNQPMAGIRDFLSPEQAESHAAFIAEYRAIRTAEGRGSDNAAHYLSLPTVPQEHPQWKEWAMRAESMWWLCRQLEAMRAGRAGVPLRVLDAGAGNCWLTRWMAEWGHVVTALDLNTDELDGLAAGRHYLEELPITFERVRADYLHLPFATAVFDVVVFNGAVHYAGDLRAVIAEAQRVLAPDGEIIIIDSPLYSDFASGMKMRAERAIQGRAGFLTFDGLHLIATALGMKLSVDLPRIGLFRRIKRRITEFRLGRETAKMGRIVMRNAER